MRRGVLTGKDSDYMLTTMTIFLVVLYPLLSFGVTHTVASPILGLLLAAEALLLGKKLIFSRVRLCYLAIAATVAVYFLCTIFRQTAEKWLVLLLLLLCSFFMATVRVSGAEVRRVSNILVFAAVAMSLYVLFCAAFPSVYLNHILPRLQIDRQETRWFISLGYGVPIGGSTTYADYMCAMASFVLIGRSLAGAGKQEKVKNALLLVLFLAAIFEEGRRGELLAFVVTLCFIGVITSGIHRGRVSRNWLTLLVAALLAAVAAVAFLAGVVRSGRIARLFSSLFSLLADPKNFAAELDSLSGKRLTLWAIAFENFLKAPVFGIGWGGFEQYVPAGFLQGLSNAHNTYLQFLCETGLVGFLLLVSPIVAVFVRTVKHTCALSESRRRRAADADVVLANTVSVGVQTFFLLLNFIDPCFYKPYSLIMLAMSFCLSDYAMKKDGYGSYAKRRRTATYPVPGAARDRGMGSEA